MKKILLIGSNSGIAKSLILEGKYDFIELSRSKSSLFNILDKSTYPKIDLLDGIVYFPGTINLKPFSNFKEKDFINDYEINVLGLINTLQFYYKSLNIESPISIKILFLTTAIITVQLLISFMYYDATQRPLRRQIKALAKSKF